MHRIAARTVTALSLAALLGTAAAPAQARSPHAEQRGGKKPVGEIVSFDPATATLVLELSGGDAMTATIDPDAQVKLEHRGRHRGTKGHGNPSEGSLEDLVAGALVLRMKVEDEEVTKIRLRPAPEAPPATVPEGDRSPDGSGGSDDVEAEDPADELSEDTTDQTDEETDDENADTPDDGESGDA